MTYPLIKGAATPQERHREGTSSPRAPNSTPLRRPCSGSKRLWLAIRHGDHEQVIGCLHVGLLRHAGILAPLAHASAPALTIVAAVLAVLLIVAVLRVVRPRLDGHR